MNLNFFILENIETNQETILTITSSIYTALLAFVCPKIFEIKEKIRRKSQILYNLLNKNLIVKFYFLFIVIFLIFNIISFFIKNDIILYINILFSIISTIISFCIYEKILNKYCFEEYKFIENLKCIDYNKKYNKNEKYTDNLKLCQDLSINIMKEGFYEEDFEKYIDKILFYFEEYVNFLHTKKFSKEEILDSLNNKCDEIKYFITPCFIMYYLINKIKEYNLGNEFNIYITKSYYKTIRKFYEKLDFSSNITEFLYFNIVKPIRIFDNIFLYKIEHQILERYDIIFIVEFFELIIEFDIKYNNSFYTKGIIRYKNMETIPIIFNLIKKIIDNNYSRYLEELEYNLYILKNWGIDIEYKKTNREQSIKNLYIKYIDNLNFSILSYLLFIKRYDLFNKYYNNLDKNCFNNIFKYLSSLLPYIINKNYSIFSAKNLMEFEKNNIKYKYYIIFYILINKKNFIQNYTNNIKYYYKDNNNNINIKNYIDIAISEIKFAVNINNEDFNEYIKNLYDIYNINNQEWIKEKLNDFLNIEEIKNNKELIKQKPDTYKKFILNIFNYININIDKYKINLMLKPLKDNIKNNFINHFTLLDLEFYQDNFFITKTNKIKNSSITLDKYYLLNLTYDDKLLDDLKTTYSYPIFTKISKHCKKINELSEIDTNIDLNDFIILSNFTVNIFNEKELEKYNINISELQNFFTGITINNIIIKNISNNIYTFNDYQIKNYEILIIDKKKIKIINNIDLLKKDITFKEINENNNKDLLNNHNKFNNIKVEIVFPIPLDVETEKDFKGYKIIIEKNNIHQ